MTRRARWGGGAILVVAVIALGVWLNGNLDRAVRFGESPHGEHVKIVKLASFTKSKRVALTTRCDRKFHALALGPQTVTLMSREGGETVLLFSNRTHYSLCVLGTSGNAAIDPVALTRSTKPIEELLSTGTTLKDKHGPLSETNTWFVVHVGGQVSSLKSVTHGTSSVTSIRNGYALVHEEGAVNPSPKSFSFGEVVGFSAEGSMVGRDSLK